MASKFWVGGGSNANWNASPTTNWANTSGGAGNQTAPVAGDSVFFDGNSGSGAVTWNTTISLATLDCTGSKNTVTHGVSVAITVSSGNLVLPTGVGGSYTTLGSTSSFTMTGTSGIQSINTNGNAIGLLTISGTGGTSQLLGDLTATTANGGVTLSGGTFDGQGFNVAVRNFLSSNSSTRVLKGSGTWTISGVSGTVVNTVGAGFDSSNFTGPIIITGTLTGVATYAFGGWTYSGGLTINANSTIFNRVITGNNTFGSLAITGPQCLQLPSNGTQTISTAFTLNGSSGNEINLFSSTVSTLTTLSCTTGTCSFSWAALRDITVSGGATFNASNSFDLGHNVGFNTFTPPQAAGPIARNMVFDRGSPY